MSSRPYPAAVNYQELSTARHRIERVIEDIHLELKQMDWVAEGSRDPEGLQKHRRELAKLLGGLRRAVLAEAKVPFVHQPPAA